MPLNKLLTTEVYPLWPKNARENKVFFTTSLYFLHILRIQQFCRSIRPAVPYILTGAEVLLFSRFMDTITQPIQGINSFLQLLCRELRSRLNARSPRITECCFWLFPTIWYFLTDFIMLNRFFLSFLPKSCDRPSQTNVQRPLSWFRKYPKKA